MPYELKRSAGKYLFNLKGEQHEVLLMSAPFPKKAEALAAIETVRKIGASEAGFELRRAATGSPFYVLKTGRDEVLCRSELFENETAAWKAMQSARKHCPTVDVRDWS
ncbi:MAG TPA: YegP family protein [Planctomycetia bacterium]|nr:YegP family protein [Planctomycetia bacterium]